MATAPASDPGNDVMSYLFGGNTDLSYEQLQRRRAVALALAGKQRGFPKNVGEGLTYLGESIGEAMQNRRLDAAEKAYADRVRGAVGATGTPGQVSTTPPARPAPASVATPVAPASATVDAVPTANTGIEGFRPAPQYVAHALEQGEPDPVMRAYFGHMASREANGQNAVSPTGAAGPWQITRGTAQQYGVPGNVRFDPAQSLVAVQQLTRNNIAQFTKAMGRPPTIPELALMHQQGATGGANLLNGVDYAQRARNLSVNRIDPNLSGPDAAKAVMAYYGLPNQQLPEAWGGPKAAPPGDAKDRVANALVAQQSATPEVAQENPTEEGPSAPGGTPLPGGDRLALANTGTMSDAPPIVPRLPVAPNEDQPTPTDIQPAPRLAQAGPGGAPGGGGPLVAPQPGASPGAPGARYGAPAPDPLDRPVPPPAPPSVGRTPQQQVDPRIGEDPTPPNMPPVTEYERKGYDLMRQFPGDPQVATYAKQLIDFGAAQRQATYQRDVEVYKGKVALREKEQLARAAFERERPKMDLELRKGEQELRDKQEQAQLTARLGGIDPAVFNKAIEKSLEVVQGIPAAQQSINNARRMITENKGMFTGTDAEVALSLSKLMRAAGFPENPKLTPTENFKAFVAPIIAQNRSSLVGNANISDADMRAAVQATGGDIRLERGSILSILNSIEKINFAKAMEHERKVNIYAGDDPNRQRMMSTLRLPMDQLVPDGAVKTLRENQNDPAALEEFDRTFHTPGLARRVLQLRR